MNVNLDSAPDSSDMLSEQTHVKCVVVLGGSFDPVHLGHVALARRFVDLLQPQELRIIPTGNPWQKNGLTANAAQRCAMLELAFADQVNCPVVIDRQEILAAERQQTNYTIDTLRHLRAEYGDTTSIVFLIGADQLQNLSSWHQWQYLFDLAHICAASRPGFQLDQTNLPQAAAKEAQQKDTDINTDTETQQVNQVVNQVLSKFRQAAATPEQIRTTPAGLTYLADDLQVDISATQIREELERGAASTLVSELVPRLVPGLVPIKVLDYIQQHHLYENTKK